MAVAKITKSVVDRLGPGAKLWDSEVMGFGARRQTTEAVCYLLRYINADGVERSFSIGRHGSPWTVETARTEARRLLGLVASGRDPQAERQAQREERKRPPAGTFGQAVERYLAHKRKEWKPGSFDQFNRHLSLHAKPLHPYPLAEITRLQIATLLDEIAAGPGPTACNRTRTSLFSFFDWLTKRGLFEGTNPIANTDRATEKPSRERVLSGPELAQLWAALGDDRFSNIVRLLILTGQRRLEIGNLRWSEVDFDRAMLVLPPERVKNGRAHEVPLAPQALAILRKLETAPARGHGKRNDGSVFSGFSGWSVAKAGLEAAINAQRPKPMAHWTLHDLRRTCATGMGELGVLPHVVECVLNHRSGFRSGVAGIYNRNTYAAEMRTALCAWANHVEAITGRAKIAA